MKQDNLQRNVFEGWTVQHYINELEPLIKLRMNYSSWLKRFETKKELEDWCKDHQPYYKKTIPEVVNYFYNKYMKD